MILAAEGTITPGEHWTVQLGGLTFNVDTIIGTIVAGLIVCGLGYYMANRATHGRPSGLQVAFEALTAWVQNQTKEGIGVRTPSGVVAFRTLPLSA